MRLRLDKRTLAFIFIFLIGLSILLYPLVSSTWNQILANRTIVKYDEAIAGIPQEDLSSYIKAARQYNSKMQPKHVPDAFSTRENTKDEEYESLLSAAGDGLMGYIEIPVLGVRSPVYHYSTEEILQKGVGHLHGSSLPVGGKGSHAVLTAHRGLPSNKLFSDLDKIKLKDRFYISVCGETFAYEVDQILTVLPDETEALALAEGKDYVTLVTCTPYGVNTHRILCRGHRVPYVPGEEDIGKRAWVNMNILMGLVGALLGILIALILVFRLRKRDDDDDEEDEPEEDRRDTGEKKTIHIR